MNNTPRIIVAALLGCAALQQASATLVDGLVAHYELNGNALDSSGNGAHGTIKNNVGWTTDRFGVPNAAVDFPANLDAINGYGINLANSSASISLWLNKQYEGNLSNGTWILHVGDVGSEGKVMLVAVDYGQSILYDFWNDGLAINTPTLPMDEWHHLAFTFDNVTHEQRIYVDGNVVGTRTSLYTFTGSDFFEFGNVNMKMDDLRFYNRVLSQAEVRELQSVPEPSTYLFGSMILGSILFSRRTARRSGGFNK